MRVRQSISLVLVAGLEGQVIASDITPRPNGTQITKCKGINPTCGHVRSCGGCNLTLAPARAGARRPPLLSNGKSCPKFTVGSEARRELAPCRLWPIQYGNESAVRLPHAGPHRYCRNIQNPFSGSACGAPVVAGYRCVWSSVISGAALAAIFTSPRAALTCLSSFCQRYSLRLTPGECR